MDAMAKRAILLLLAAAAAGEDADEYFEIGVVYLHQGFFGPARRAFGESLLQAPGQPVPLAFMGIASAAEGRAPAEASWLLRQAYASLPDGKTLRLDLAALLPSGRALRLLKAEYRRRLERAGGKDRRDVLSVAAFLEVHGGDAAMPSLERLSSEWDDGFASRLRASVRPSSPPTSPATSSVRSAAAAGSRSSRSRRS